MKKTPGQLRKEYVLIAGSLISASFVVAESEQQMSVAYTDLISSGLLEGYLSLLCRRLKSTKLQNQDGGTMGHTVDITVKLASVTKDGASQEPI